MRRPKDRVYEPALTKRAWRNIQADDTISYSDAVQFIFEHIRPHESGSDEELKKRIRARLRHPDRHPAIKAMREGAAPGQDIYNLRDLIFFACMNWVKGFRDYPLVTSGHVSDAAQAGSASETTVIPATNKRDPGEAKFNQERIRSEIQHWKDKSTANAAALYQVIELAEIERAKRLELEDELKRKKEHARKSQRRGKE